jgi:hypothetical protein
MSEYGFDPRLKAAMHEIQEVCERYDCASSVILVSSTHSEYMYNFPSWSAMHVEENERGETGLRFRSKREDHVNEASQKAIYTATVSIVQAFVHISAQTFQLFNHVLDTLNERASVTGGLKDHRPGLASDKEIADKYRQLRRR